MKLKYILLSLSILAISANAGIFDHDKAYYKSHLEDAEEKIKDCQKEMAIARIDKNKDKVISLTKDQECKDAFDAIRENKSKIRKVKYEANQRKRASDKGKKEAAFKMEYDKQLTELKSLNYEKFIVLKQEICSNATLYGDRLSLKNAKCKAWKDLKQSKEDEAIQNLLTLHPKEKILEYRDQICQNALYGNSKCDLARKAFDKKRDLVVQFYLSDKAALKKDFNDCYHKINNFNKSSNYKKAQSTQKSYKCYMAKEAAIKFNIYGYFKPIN